MTDTSTSASSHGAFRECLDEHGGLRLNLGCGNKRRAGYLGVDRGEASAVDVRMDVLEYLKTLPAGAVSSVYSRHMLEHFEPEPFRQLLEQIDRVLRPGGEIEIIVPHFSNPYFYSDPTHRQPFGLYSFSYLCERTCLTRGVPSYVRIEGWSLEDVQFGFSVYGEWKRGRLPLPPFAKIVERFVNRKRDRMEWYERFACWIYSIYEIQFRIKKSSSAS